MKQVDLNCDVGELPEALADGSQEEIMRYISSANIACGGHAGDAQMMRATVEQALRYGVAVGAHPGYEDRASFGRRELQLPLEEIADLVYRQIVALAEIAEQRGATISHVKTHGALYNQGSRNREIARAIAAGVQRWRRDVALIGLAGSEMLDEFRRAGFPVAAEAFADRRYEKDGSLRSRKFPDALLSDPEEAAEQAWRIVEGKPLTTVDGDTTIVYADSICLHGDSPNAVDTAAAIHRKLTQAEVAILPLAANI
jgi:5-oxoprolinase (ATP-hydrolysing) subunit A